jgi:hypothetical protein
MYCFYFSILITKIELRGREHQKENLKSAIPIAVAVNVSFPLLWQIAKIKNNELKGGKFILAYGFRGFSSWSAAPSPSGTILGLWQH